ncbi:helix-turn-helix domain-containing protein [Consotaella aegiceratis]|uniref:helix-turn-helix domain-containing protein n=1 Tax=Consotaella aegiceratis TaxID=3097961 RepID=UPI002F412D38
MADDIAAYDDAKRRLASGEDEMIPAEFAHRLLDGENPIRVWREFRGMTATQLAERIGIAKAYLSQLESGRREGSMRTLRALAEVLKVDVDDLI